MSVQRFEDTLDLFIPETPDSNVKPFTLLHRTAVKQEGMVSCFPDFGVHNGVMHHRCGRPAGIVPSKRMQAEAKPGMPLGTGNYRPTRWYCLHCTQEEIEGTEEM
jgi:hypothetical protein